MRESAFVLDHKGLRTVIATLAFTAFGIMAPLIHHQLATGILVNALLFSAVRLLGVRSALCIALFPSLMALAVGLIPLAQSSVVVWVILSNALLVVLFHWLKSKFLGFRIILCGVAKFLFLFLFVLPFFLNFCSREEAKVLCALFGVSQLITAIGGGVFSLGIVRLLKKTPWFSLS